MCLSGGLDSTAAMLVCRREWGAVRAVFVDTRGMGPPDEARASAALLGVPLHVADARDAFAEQVRLPAEQAYSLGLTPNPCVMCNARVKLALPFRMLVPGEYMVTGHYARSSDAGLERAADRGKDQSYFLAMVPGDVLSRCRFPLAGLTKADVRRMVLDAGLPFIARESQDLCFPLERRGEPGDIVTVEGRRAGRHKGLQGFTVGQRRGVGAHGIPMYVVRLDIGSNTVVVGGREHLFSPGCLITDVNDLGLPLSDRFEALLQLRSRHRATPVTALRTPRGFSIRFKNPQSAVAQGQTGVFYNGDTVLGAGMIRSLEG